MCRIYSSAIYPYTGRWVRACYRTGHQGVQVPIAQAVWNKRYTHLLAQSFVPGASVIYGGSKGAGKVHAQEPHRRNDGK